MQNFELACTFSDCETAILYRKDFNLTKLLNAILSFVFIIPAQILLISSGLADVPAVFWRLTPEKKLDNDEQNKLWKQKSEQGV